MRCQWHSEHFLNQLETLFILRQISNAYILLHLIPFTLVILIWMLREIKTIVVVVVAMHVYLKNHSSKINKGYKSKDNDGWRWELNIFLKNSQFASLHFDFDHPLINNKGFFLSFFSCLLKTCLFAFFPSCFSFYLAFTCINIFSTSGNVETSCIF